MNGGRTAHCKVLLNACVQCMECCCLAGNDFMHVYSTRYAVKQTWLLCFWLSTACSLACDDKHSGVL